MVLSTQVVTTAMIGDSGGSRLDSRFHMRQRLVSNFIDGLIAVTPLSTMIATISNGANLPRAAYADEPTTDGVYVSVGSFSSFVYRDAAAAGILVGENGRISGTVFETSKLAVTDDEVLVTRSGTPGIAWPASLRPADKDVVPSGFMIRITLESAEVASFVAAILNHPVWRIVSNGLSAGKRQDNLGQKQIAAIPIPVLPAEVMESIGSEYQETLREIELALNDDGGFARACDRVIESILGLKTPILSSAPVRAREIRLFEVAEASSSRLDNRWHGEANQLVTAALKKNPFVELASLVVQPIAKGRQPIWPAEDEVDEYSPFAVATITIQAGRVVDELLKPTVTESVESFRVKSGDVLVAMDGEGSLGKAALYTPSSDGTIDSHVARCRVDGGPDLSAAIVCFLNSTWGRAQSDGRKSGATGQTQLTPDDLGATLIPKSLIDQAEAVSTAFQSILTTFELPSHRARRLLSANAAKITRTLVDNNALTEAAAVGFSDASDLYAKLNILYPSIRQR